MKSNNQLPELPPGTAVFATKAELIGYISDCARHSVRESGTYVLIDPLRARQGWAPVIHDGKTHLAECTSVRGVWYYHVREPLPPTAPRVDECSGLSGSRALSGMRHVAAYMKQFRATGAW